MPWYGIVIIVCIIIGPFEALYQYIRAQKRREELRRRREASREKNDQAEGQKLETDERVQGESE